MSPNYDLMKEGDVCEQCGYGVMRASEQKDDDGTPIYMSCSECDTHQIMYVPLPHQDLFHSDPHKYRGFFGGYG